MILLNHINLKKRLFLLLSTRRVDLNNSNLGDHILNTGFSQYLNRQSALNERDDFFTIIHNQHKTKHVRIRLAPFTASLHSTNIVTAIIKKDQPNFSIFTVIIIVQQHGHFRKSHLLLLLNI